MEEVDCVDVGTNLRYIKRSTKKPEKGSIFTMLPPDGKYLFGRVIEAALPRARAPMPGANLIYIYAARSHTKEPPFAQLIRSRLLVAPIYTNRMAWTKGIFATVAKTEINKSDLLQQHCFWDALRKRYIDVDQRPLDDPVEPCGSWGLVSFRKIDDLLSDALGIARVPVD